MQKDDTDGNSNKLVLNLINIKLVKLGESAIIKRRLRQKECIKHLRQARHYNEWDILHLIPSAFSEQIKANVAVLPQVVADREILFCIASFLRQQRDQSCNIADSSTNADLLCPVLRVEWLDSPLAKRDAYCLSRWANLVDGPSFGWTNIQALPPRDICKYILW